MKLCYIMLWLNENMSYNEVIIWSCVEMMMWWYADVGIWYDDVNVCWYDDVVFDDDGI